MPDVSDLQNRVLAAKEPVQKPVVRGEGVPESTSSPYDASAWSQNVSVMPHATPSGRRRSTATGTTRGSSGPAGCTPAVTVQVV